MGRPLQVFVALLMAAGAASSHALSALSEGDMAAVAGQDGIAISVQRAGALAPLPVGSLVWTNTTPVTDAAVTWSGMSNSNLSGLATTLNMSFDIGASTNAALGLPIVNISASIPRNRLLATGFFHSNSPALSNGQMAIDTGGTFSYAGPLWMDEVAATAGSINLDMMPSSLYYRQGGAGAPEWTMNNMELDFASSAAFLNIAPTGLTLDAASATVKLVSDFTFDANGTSPFAITAIDRPTITSGWSGGLNSFRARLAPGGVWTGGDPGYTGVSTRAAGINLGLRWNFDNATFNWELGETADPAQAPAAPPKVRFDQWQSMSAGTFAFNFPNITLGPINAGQDPGGLCWLGSSNLTACTGNGRLIDVPAENGALALLIRDAHLGGYSSRVQILDDVNRDGDYADTVSGQPETVAYGWGLIYTFGDVDANFYLYPGGGNANNGTAHPGTTATVPGLRSDFVLKFGSRGVDSGDMDNDGNTTEVLGPDITSNDPYTGFAQGTHFMIGDTTAGYAIGFHSGDFLIAANDAYVSILSSGLNFATAQGRLAFKARFGGGTFPTLVTPVKGFDLDVNFETNNYELNLLGSPPCGTPPCATYLQYNGTLDLADLDTANFSNQDNTVSDTTVSELNDDDGSYISLAEPGRPAVDIRFARISGRVRFANGTLDITSTADNAASQPANLRISHDLQIGATAGGAPLRIDRVEFGDRSLGTIVMPSGVVRATFALKCQTTTGICL
ncbi:MAG: hypothetical protein ACOY3X_01620 [Pseudomonadota bacterium]